MSSVNLYAKEISLKIVYYGPGLGGKTSSLQHIHRAIKPDARGQLVSLSTGIDRTLYFDFLPVKLPKLRGYTVRVQLYTVPGQVHYNSTRKLVLTGADGVVFVADSQRARHDANIESLTNLRENLREQALTLDRVAHLFQYNKRDMADVLPVAEMTQSLNIHGAPVFETCATSGHGVFEALKSITTLVLSDLRRRGVWRTDAPSEAVGVPNIGTPPVPASPTASAPTLVMPTPLSNAPAPAAVAVTITTGGGGASGAFPIASGVPEEITREDSGSRTPTEGSISESLQALADRTEERDLMLRPLQPEEGVGSSVDGGMLGRGAALSEILPPGSGRDGVVAVEYLVHRGDYAAAVTKANRIFADIGRADGEMASGADGLTLHALMLGMPGGRYLRFRETVQRAASGGASSADALFALFFLVDAVMRGSATGR